MLGERRLQVAGAGAGVRSDLNQAPVLAVEEKLQTPNQNHMINVMCNLSLVLQKWKERARFSSSTVLGEAKAGAK